MKTKKLSFVSMVLFCLLLMTSCKKDPAPTPTPTPTPEPTIVEPTLTLVEGEGYLAEGAEITVGNEVKVGFVVTGENLIDLKVVFLFDNDTIATNTLSCSGLSQTTIETSFTLMQVGDITMNAVLTDGNDHTAALSLNFKGLEVPPPVSNDINGLYEGYLKIEGSVAAFGNSFPVNDSTNAEMTITVMENNQLTAVFVYQGTSFDISGSLEGNRVVFDPFPLEISNSDVQLTASILLNGTVEENVLLLEGDLSDCVLNYTGLQIPVTFEGEIGGVLEKSRKPYY